jgi:hypothetical protein
MSPIDPLGSALDQWDKMRVEVLEPNGISFGHYSEPESWEEMCRLTETVNNITSGVFGERVQGLAKGEVGRALFDEHEITPELLLEYAAEGLIPLPVVTEFNVSAAKYIEKRLDKAGILIGPVIESAIAYLTSYRHFAGSALTPIGLREFFEAAELSPELLDFRPEELEKHYDRFRKKVGDAIKRSIMLLFNYGWQNADEFLTHHLLSTYRMNLALNYDLFDMPYAAALYQALTSTSRGSSV